MTNIIRFIKPVIFSIAFLLPIIYGTVLGKRKKLDTKMICTIIFICGFILRIAYLSYTDEYTRQHDVGYFFERNMKKMNTKTQKRFLSISQNYPLLQ